MKSFFYLPLILVFAFMACENPQSENTSETQSAEPVDSLRYPEENHLKNIRQLTFGGNNAEAYFSFDNQFLIFQSDNPTWDVQCDQIFLMPLSGVGDTPPPMLSTGEGRTTCSFFLPGNQSILYASTHKGGKPCPNAPRVVDGKYVWAIFPDFDIFTADLEGNITGQLTDSPGYDAEATLSPDGSRIVFTSMRSGDPELYVMNTDGTELKQVTDGLGYDGGAFFSPDGTKLVFRASRPKSEEEVANYKGLLAKDLVQPTEMEIYTCNIDGSDLTQITELGGANWAPYFTPSGDKIIFSSNHHSESGRQFNLFMVNLDGSGLEQITFDAVFDAFPMFSYDGKYLVFSSNRFNGGNRDTNVYLAEWVE
jgi:Tol biopolymer transport system component